MQMGTPELTSDSGIEDALLALKEGKFILLHDSESRENEIDMVVAAEHASPKHIAIMRTDAGGLLCLALGNQVGKKLGLPYLRDVFSVASERYPVLEQLNERNAPYGGKSAFSITVNHRRTFTGVTDHDRALTIAELSNISRAALDDGTRGLRRRFATEFRAPGHVHLLIEAERSIAERRGHTELSVHLCRFAGLAPAAVICEMLDGRTHKALSIRGAATYAKKNLIPLVDGQRVITHFLESDNNSRGGR